MWERALKATLRSFNIRLPNIIRNILLLLLSILILRFALGANEQIEDEVRWIISSGGAIGAVFLFTFAFHLVRAPVYLKFENEQKSNLRIKEVKEENYHTVGQSWGLVIENSGIEDAEMCEAQLLEIEFTAPQKGLSMARWPVNRRLLLEGEGTIRGKSNKLLHISYLTPISSDHMELQLAYEESEEFRHEHAISDETRDILLVISISSRNTLPIYSVLRLCKRSIGWSYDLIILVNHIATLPSVKDYQISPK